MKERNADRTSSRSILFLAFLFTAVAATAQDACYLLGNDSDTPQANHASATLTKVSDGVFQGEVNFNSKGFYVATKLASTADDWESIDNDVWCGNSKYGRKLTIGESYTMQRGHSTRYSVPFRIQGGTYKVTVDFNQETILAEESSTPDPGSDPDPEPEPERPRKSPDYYIIAAGIDSFTGYRVEAAAPDAETARKTAAECRITDMTLYGTAPVHYICTRSEVLARVDDNGYHAPKGKPQRTPKKIMITIDAWELHNQ
jgi:hypothetical protein